MAASPEPDPLSGRRAYDRDVDPAIQLFVETEIRGVRHGLRGELAEALLRIEVAQTKAAAQASLEHAEVRKDLGVVIVEQTSQAARLETVLPLVSAVSELQRHDAHDEGRLEGVSELRKTLWTAAGVIVAAIGVAMTVLLAIPH
ncbi:MAG: hypothetical protein JWM47_4552 [Acidimicrobiales bacterium]|nr:hypothetical protein [Acidimicrobiales bacterium]